nr:hypothetical protein [Micromonospora sp. DSM 115978]
MSVDHSAAREESRVALITCDKLPDLDDDDKLLLGPLADLGIRAEPVVWDASDTDWSAFDLAVLRSAWDYVGRRDEFVAWAARTPRLANPADVVAWNTDKRYLAALAEAGRQVVPTTWITPTDRWEPPTDGEHVIKPAVGAGSADAGRYQLTDPDHRRLAVTHVDRLRAAGRTVMVQPYLPAIDSAGETALLYFGGPDGLEFSHAVRKDAMLAGPDDGATDLFKPERITARTPELEQLAVARRALAVVPGGPDRLLYARVDLIPGPAGQPLLAELELTEPSLFLGYAPGAPQRMADAIAARLRSSGA